MSVTAPKTKKTHQGSVTPVHGYGGPSDAWKNSHSKDGTPLATLPGSKPGTIAPPTPPIKPPAGSAATTVVVPPPPIKPTPPVAAPLTDNVPVDPAWTPEQLIQKAEHDQSTGTDLAGIDATLADKKTNLDYARGQLVTQYKAAAAAAADAMAARGIFRSSISDGVQFDLTAQRAIQDGFLKDQLSNAQTAADTAKASINTANASWLKAFDAEGVDANAGKHDPNEQWLLTHHMVGNTWVENTPTATAAAAATPAQATAAAKAPADAKLATQAARRKAALAEAKKKTAAPVGTKKPTAQKPTHTKAKH